MSVLIEIMPLLLIRKLMVGLIGNRQKAFPQKLWEHNFHKPLMERSPTIFLTQISFHIQVLYIHSKVMVVCICLVEVLLLIKITIILLILSNNNTCCIILYDVTPSILNVSSISSSDIKVQLPF